MVSGGENYRLPGGFRLYLVRPFYIFTKRETVTHLLLIALERIFMTATGELIRMMNYVDDIAATLRRINASLYLITARRRSALPNTCASRIRTSIGVVEQLEKGA